MTLNDWWWLWSLTFHNAITIGIDDHCDYSPLAIQDVVAKHPHVRLSNQTAYPPLIIKQPLQLWGGYANCQAAKRSIPTKQKSTLLGHGQSPVIRVTNDHPQPISVDLRGLELRFGHAFLGAGIQAQGHYRLSITDSLVNNNQGLTQGGGIYLSGEFNRIHIRDSAINQNFSTLGAGIYVSGQNNLLTIENSIFKGNHAAWFGHDLACDGSNWISFYGDGTTPSFGSWALNYALECEVEFNSLKQPMAWLPLLP